MLQFTKVLSKIFMVEHFCYDNRENTVGLYEASQLKSLQSVFELYGNAFYKRSEMIR